MKKDSNNNNNNCITPTNDALLKYETQLVDAEIMYTEPGMGFTLSHVLLVFSYYYLFFKETTTTITTTTLSDKQVN